MVDLAVIMSIYKNDQLFVLKESIQSILTQTYTQFHYYLIIDGPVSGGIEEYISSLKDERIMLFHLESNEGLAKALNFLLEKVMKNPEFMFIARMDADDISMPERFEHQRSFLNTNPTVSIVGCWYEEIDENGKCINYRRLPIEHSALRKRYLTRTPFAHASVMFRRELIEKAGLYPTDTILMEDNVLWGRALKVGLKFANIPKCLFKFRIDKNHFKRRSGFRYGWNYIRSRFSINRSLSFPFYSYFFSLSVGFIKMMPSSLKSQVIAASRKFNILIN
jgi:glycosyltransferase involved in cell wall biosynthesis